MFVSSKGTGHISSYNPETKEGDIQTMVSVRNFCHHSHRRSFVTTLSLWNCRNATMLLRKQLICCLNFSLVKWLWRGDPGNIKLHSKTLAKYFTISGWNTNSLSMVFWYWFQFSLNCEAMCFLSLFRSISCCTFDFLTDPLSWLTWSCNICVGQPF